MKSRLLILLSLAAICWAAVGIQGNHTGASTPTLGANGGSITYGSSTAGASMLFVMVSSFQSSTCTIADTVGGSATTNVWNGLTTASNAPFGGNTRLMSWYAYKSNGGASPLVTGATHVVTLTCTSSFAAMNLIAATGTLITADPLRAQAQADVAGSGSSMTVGPVTTVSGDLVILAVGQQAGAQTISSPWTQLESISGGGYMSGMDAWLIAASTTQSGTTTGGAGTIASFRPAPVGQPSIMMIQGEEFK